MIDLGPLECDVCCTVAEGMFFYTTMEYVIAGHSPGGEAIVLKVDAGHWGLCQTCYSLAQANNLEALVERGDRAVEASHPDSLCHDVNLNRALYRGFLQSRTGEPTYLGARPAAKG